jgi:hypothetical protein
MGQFYPYLYAGLPELSLEHEVKGFDYDRIIKDIQQHLEGKDKKCLRLLLTGIAPQMQTPYFYCTTARYGNRFLKEYFEFDRILRNAQAEVAAKKLGVEARDYLIDEGSPAEVPSEILQVIEIPNLLEREQKIDALRWNKANEITIFNYLDTDAILAFVIKANIVNRWMSLDKTRGTELFRQLVQEVRGTFDIKKVVE